MIRAELIGDATATAEGLTINNPSPVLALCRKLLNLGYADQPLEAYRGDVLCLYVRSIDEAATLRVGPRATTFVKDVPRATTEAAG